MDEPAGTEEAAPHPVTWQKADLAWAGPVVLIALALRTAFVLEMCDTFFFDLNLLEGMDMSAYLAWARDIASGGWLGEHAFYRAPLYPYFLAVLLRVSGGSLFFVCVVQAALGALSAAAMYAAARHVLSPAWSALSSALLALYEASVFFTIILHSTTLEVFLASVTLLVMMRAARRVTPGRWAVLGICVGITSLARPNFLLFAPVIVFAPLVVSRWPVASLSHWPRGRAAVAPAAAFVLCFLLIVLPVALRNTILSGRVSAVSTSGAETFRLANSYDSAVFNFNYPERGPMPVLSAAFWTHQARKALGFWTAWEVPQNVNMYLCRRYSRTLRFSLVPFLLIGPLALAGAFLGRDRFRHLAAAYVFAATYYASIVPFFVISRFRLPVVPALAVFASVAAERIIGFWRSGDRARALLYPAVVLLLALCATFPWNICRIPANSLDSLARAAVMRGDHAHAADLLSQSLALRPDSPSNRYTLGAFLAEQNRTEEAIRHLERAVALRPEDPRPYRTLALVWARQKNDPAQALRWLDMYFERATDPKERTHMAEFARSLEDTLKGRPDS